MVGNGWGLEAFAFQALAFHLACARYGLGLFACAFFRRLFKVLAKLEFTENTFPLHLLLQDLQRLVNVVIADDNLHVTTSFQVRVKNPESLAFEAFRTLIWYQRNGAGCNTSNTPCEGAIFDPRFI